MNGYLDKPDWEKRQDDIEKSSWRKNPIKMLIYTISGIFFVAVIILVILQIIGIIDVFHWRVGTWAEW